MLFPWVPPRGQAAEVVDPIAPALLVAARLDRDLIKLFRRTLKGDGAEVLDSETHRNPVFWADGFEGISIPLAHETLDRLLPARPVAAK